MTRFSIKFAHIAVVLLSATLTSIAFANPEGGVVTSGNANISSSGNTTTINQASQQTILNWNSFNIAANEKTQFVQPNASSVALNRINPNMGASQIYGQLTANGQIILVNGAGVHFGPNSMVNVGSLIASTSDISNANFLAGKYNFDRPSSYHGAIVNEGKIIAAKNGLVALLGDSVSNTGLISAKLGSVALGSGSKFYMSFNDNQLISFSVDSPASVASTGIRNSGKLIANGGQILVTAKAASSVLDNVIDMNGIATTKSVSQQGGEIILSGFDGFVTVTGMIVASGLTGGTIEVLANNIEVGSSATINASGTNGGGNIYIGGSEHGTGPLPDAQTTEIDAGAMLNASAGNSGNGGNVIVWSNKQTNFAGTILAEGGANGGNGGFSEVSSEGLLNFTGGNVNLTAAHGAIGTLLLDPENVTIQTGGSSSDPITGGTFTPTQSNSILTIADLEAALSTSNVVVTTGSTGSQAGDITVANDVSWSSGNSLTLTAADIINLNANISGNDASSSITLNASHGVIVNNSITLTAGSKITVNGTVDSAGSPVVTFGPGTSAVFNSAHSASVNGGPTITFGPGITFAGDFTPYTPQPTPSSSTGDPSTGSSGGSSTVVGFIDVVNVVNSPTTSNSQNSASSQRQAAADQTTAQEAALQQSSVVIAIVQTNLTQLVDDVEDDDVTVQQIRQFAAS